MTYDYIATVNNSGPEQLPSASDLLLQGAWRGTGGSSASLALYTSKDTPVARLGQDGVILGHLLDRNGALIADGRMSSVSGETYEVFQHLLTHWWGDYVAIQPSFTRGGFDVLSSPSCSSVLPCIYSFRDGQGFITSSATLATRLGLLRKRIDWDYIAQFLTFPFLKTERSPIIDVMELLPGMRARFTVDGVSTDVAWTPWDFVVPHHRYVDLSEAASCVRSAVSIAVRGLATTDKTILLELSGGLDSSIVGACLRNCTATVVCSTLVPPIRGADERIYAALIANALRTELRTVHLPVAAAGFSFKDHSDPIRPGVGPLQFAIDSLMEADAHATGVNSAFSGGGGDTVFCYLTTAAPAVDAFREQGLFAGLRTVHDLALLHNCSLRRALQLAIRKYLRPPRPPYRPDYTFLMPSGAQPTLMDHPWHLAPADALPGDRERIFELAGSQIYMDYLPRRSKRFFRMPLLSQPVMEACLRAPTWMWISGGQNRAVARAAFSDSLPGEILHRRSKGTFMNYLGVVYEQNKNSMLDFLLSGNLRSRGILDPAALERFVRTRQPPRDQTFSRILDLCRVENWTRQQE